MVEVKKLKKLYTLSKKQIQKDNAKENKKIAVNNISFQAKEGEILGLLGPNGAGKTTTLRCIATLLKATEGEILVQGVSVKSKPETVRRKICLLTNELKLDKHFTPSYTIKYFGRLYGLSEEIIEERKKELFNKFAISEYEHMKIAELSTGMSQKLSIAVSLIHDPDVIIFDEPTNGLDIITARTVTDYLFELKQKGKVVIISTHIMNVAAKLCDRIVILINGKIKANGELNEILAYTGQKDLEDAFFKLYNRK